MTTQARHMTRTVERRVQNASQETGIGLRDGPPTETALAAAKKQAAIVRQIEQAPALTRRERRVKDILLKELGKFNLNDLGASGLSYAQKQHLEKNLNVAFLDNELETIRKRLAQGGLVLKGLGIITTGLVLFAAWSYIQGAVFEWRQLLPLLIPISGIGSYAIQMRSWRRKQFIYEALRELSGAEEVDIILDQAARDADDLIRRIVDRELEAEKAYPLGLIQEHK